MGFKKNNIIRFKHFLQKLDEIICFNYTDIKANNTKALCILLYCLDYLNPVFNLTTRFGRPIPQLCMIFNQTLI